MRKEREGWGKRRISGEEKEGRGKRGEKREEKRTGRLGGGKQRGWEREEREGKKWEAVPSLHPKPLNFFCAIV